MYLDIARNRKRKDSRRNPESVFLASSRRQCYGVEIGTSGGSSCAAGAATGMGRSGAGLGGGCWPKFYKKKELNTVKREARLHAYASI